MAEPIRFRCRHCGASHEVPASRAGKTGRCDCGKPMTVPAASEGCDRAGDERKAPPLAVIGGVVGVLLVSLLLLRGCPEGGPTEVAGGPDASTAAGDAGGGVGASDGDSRTTSAAGPSDARSEGDPGEPGANDGSATGDTAGSTGSMAERPLADVPAHVLVIAIDEATERELGAWTRSSIERHAELIDRLDAAGAAGAIIANRVTTDGEETPELRRLVDAALRARLPVVLNLFAQKVVTTDRGDVEGLDNTGERRQLDVKGEITGWSWKVKPDPIEGTPIADRRLGKAVGIYAFEAIIPEGHERMTSKDEFESKLRIDGWYAEIDLAGYQPLAFEMLRRTGHLHARSPTELRGLVEPFPADFDFHPKTTDRPGRVDLTTREGIRVPEHPLEELASVAYADVLAGRVPPERLRGALCVISRTWSKKKDLRDRYRKLTTLHASLLEHLLELAGAGGWGERR